MIQVFSFYLFASLLIASAAMVLLLVIGALYWRGKVRQLKGSAHNWTGLLRVLARLQVLALGLTAGSLLVFADLLGVPIPVFPEALEKAVPPAFGVGAAVRVLYAAYGVLTAGLYVVFFGMPRARNG